MTTHQSQSINRGVPLILAPAGNKASFLAALSAEADAVYCGLKTFSARMEAKNFSVEELVPLTELAREKGTRVYVTMNSLLKPGELNTAGRLLDQLNRQVKPDALIIQDLSVVNLALETGFSGEIHLSTLASVTFPQALKEIRKKLGARIRCVVLPREIGIDAIKNMAQACPPELDLEVFIHGALCYGVSGRCYWSSYLGGKSGLRGRCVQPCRRLYTQSDSPGETEKKGKRFFSCQDLSLDVLVKALLSVPKIKAWKIEGRKKSPHYVFYTVTAYRMLRDHGNDPQMKKAALGLLSQSLGRPGTHYYFLPQRPQNPIDIHAQTGSGLFAGKLKGEKQSPYLVPRTELLPGDMLRIGYEDDSRHSVRKVGKYVPKGGRLHLNFFSPKPDGGPVQKTFSYKDAPVFLTDRREKALQEMLSELEKKLGDPPGPKASNFQIKETGFSKKNPVYSEIRIKRKFGKSNQKHTGIWLPKSPDSQLISNRQPAWWWLPPVIWPEEEKQWRSAVDTVLKKGARHFVLNSPWQIALFSNSKDLNLWAGPFCNLTNSLSVRIMETLGFSGAVVSPELGREDILQFPKYSPLPLGIVISGNWPLCISRIPPENLKPDTPFTSPKGEQAWFRKYDDTIWVYPNWKLDIREKKQMLRKAGYSMFVHLSEPVPETVQLKKRPGIWNWNLNIL
jgi:putative protease